LPTEIKVPTLGESVTTATVARWMKHEGDSVAADEAIVELETDKVTVEVAAPSAGVLTSIAVPEGGEVEVGALLAMLDAAGSANQAKPAAAERPPAAIQDAPKPPAAPPAPPPAEAPPAPPPPPAASLPNAFPIAPASRPAANPPAGVNPPPRPLGPVSRPAAMPPGTNPLFAPLPAAAKMIAEQQVDPGAIGAGSGKDGRITKGDVLAFLNRPVPEQQLRPPGRPKRTDDPREQRVRMTRLRRTIGQRLKEAQNTAAMLTTFNEVDMSAVMALRAEYRAAFEKKHNGIRLGFMSFFVRACCVALKEFPSVNAEIDGEDIIYKNFVNMGIAVGGPSGLVVPVIRDADSLSFAGIEGAIADFGKRVRDGGMTLADLAGGSFSITNGGIYGSLMSTPILNTPQSAILGMHKIQDRAMVIGGKVEVRPMMYLAVSYDHRIIDGKEAVSFLVRIKECIEDPRRLLLDV
jgi:2-oxoglutarate dehydrogenase E2 component (dihydrolipoamide succinyltransferase)